MKVEPANISEECEGMIELIPGILAARVVVANGEIWAMHILADGTCHPGQLAQDIAGNLLAHYDICVDPERINIVQTDAAPTAQQRLELCSITSSVMEKEAEVCAQLQWQQRTLTGTARGPATSRGCLALAAEAVLLAVAQVLPADVRFALGTLDTMTTGGSRTVLVLVSLLQGRQVQELAGAAIVRDDEIEAAGRATLAAINRRIEQLVDFQTR